MIGEAIDRADNHETTRALVSLDKTAPLIRAVLSSPANGAGWHNSDVTVTFAFTNARTTDYVPLSTDPAGTSYPAGSTPSDPCYGEKGMAFTFTVSGIGLSARVS